MSVCLSWMTQIAPFHDCCAGRLGFCVCVCVCCCRLRSPLSPGMMAIMSTATRPRVSLSSSPLSLSSSSLSCRTTARLLRVSTTASAQSTPHALAPLPSSVRLASTVVLATHAAAARSAWQEIRGPSWAFWRMAYKYVIVVMTIDIDSF